MPLPYKPAADSRHRRACFALYRALVRQGLQIPLPNDILENTKNNPIPKNFAPRSSSYLVGGRKDGNPIPNLIINAFRRNKKLTSPRLTCLALKNGYRFLDLFAQAKAQAPPPPGVTAAVRDLLNQTAERGAAPPEQCTSGPEPLDPSRPIYNQIIAFLRENQARVNGFLLKREASKKPNTFRPHRDHQPLLTLLPPPEDDPDAKPVYVPTVRPRPLSQLSGGVRRVPTLDDCSGYPFLRLSKPQSPVLSVMVWNNSRCRQERIYRYQEMRDEKLVMGQMEDEWEDVVEGMLQVMIAATEEGQGPNWQAFILKLEQKRQDTRRKEAQARRNKWKSQSQSQQSEAEDWIAPPEGHEKIDWANKPELTYADSWQISLDELGARLTRQYDHWVARGRALWELVKAERELAEKEAKERGRGVQRPVSPRYREKIRGWKGAWERKQLKDREDRIKEAEERGDLEEAEKLREQTFRVTPPRRMGFSKREMRNSIT